MVGHVHIGTQIGVLAEHRGMQVLFSDIEAKSPLGNARETASLDELLRCAGVVSLHAPQTPGTVRSPEPGGMLACCYCQSATWPG
ncbi:MAG: NAD(P)-dependent oxidoreductase [Burkholderiaceae bacterium]